MKTTTQGKRWVWVAVVVVAVAAFVGWRQWSRWRGPEALPLDTPEVPAFSERLRAENDDVSEVSVTYRTADNSVATVDVEVAGSAWEQGRAEELAQEVAALARDEAFQASARERYAARYGHDAASLVVQAHFTSNHSGVAMDDFTYVLQEPGFELRLTGGAAS